MPKYFVVNQKDREIFEKRNHAPYGYSKSKSFDDEKSAIAFVETSIKIIRDNLVVEKLENGVSEVVYCGYWYDPEWDILVDGFEPN